MLKFKIELSKEQIEDVLVTALEGGSNYWYYITDTQLFGIDLATKHLENKNLSFAERLLEYIELGGEIKINDIENPKEVLGTISLKTMAERTENLINDGYLNHIVNVIEENFDANDSDIIFQYWVLNDAIYG